jgi:hypothetical protein
VGKPLVVDRDIFLPVAQAEHRAENLKRGVARWRQGASEWPTRSSGLPPRRANPVPDRSPDVRGPGNQSKAGALCGQARFIGIHRTQAAPVIATRRGTQLRLGVRHPNGIGLSHREFAITCASPRPSCAIWRHAASSSFDEDAIHTLQFVNTG